MEGMTRSKRAIPERNGPRQFTLNLGMDILAGRERRCYPRLVAGLTGTRNSAGDVRIALVAVLCCNAHVDEVAFNQHGGIDDVLISTKDGKEGTVGRRHVDLAEERV